MDRRVRAAEAWIKALRTGEASATATAAAYLASDVVLDTVGAHMWGNGHEEFLGYAAVVETITGIGVMTGVYHGGAWADPIGAGDRVTATADLGGGLLASATLTFSFDEQGRISRVEHVNTPAAPPTPTDRLAPEVEQKHDPQRHGAALIVDLDRVSGNTPRGGVRMQRVAGA